MSRLSRAMIGNYNGLTLAGTPAQWNGMPVAPSRKLFASMCRELLQTLASYTLT